MRFMNVVCLTLRSSLLSTLYNIMISTCEYSRTSSSNSGSLSLIVRVANTLVELALAS